MRRRKIKYFKNPPLSSLLLIKTSMKNTSIASQQQAMIDHFQLLKHHPDLALDHLISLGKELPSLPMKEKKEAYLVSGCLARVYLLATYKEGKLFFQGDSESTITKGLLAVLITVFTAQTPTDILNADLSFITQMNLPNLLGVQRRTGMGAMISKIREYAKTYKNKKTS